MSRSPDRNCFAEDIENVIFSPVHDEKLGLTEVLIFSHFHFFSFCMCFFFFFFETLTLFAQEQEQTTR